MRKKITLNLSLLLLLVQFAFCQTTKKYNGNFSTTNFTGIATYDYIESDDERIFNGNFNFKTKDNSLVIKGSFLDNKKHGNWEIVYNNANVGLMRAGTITAKIYGKYNNGNLEGKWVFDRKSSILTSGGGAVIDKSIASFKNNLFSGNFIYESNFSLNRMGAKNIKINGSFDENGFCHGTWSLSYVEEYSNISYVQTMEYSHGLLVTLKEKNLSTGETKSLQDNTSTLDEFFSNFDYNTNESIINDKVYSLLVKKDGSKEDVLNDFSYRQSSTKVIVKGNCEECKDLDEAFSIWYKEEQYNDLNYLGEFNRGINEVQPPFNSLYLNGRKTYDLSEIKRKEEIERKKIELEKEKLERERKREEERKIREEKMAEEKRIEEEKRKRFNEITQTVESNHRHIRELYTQTNILGGQRIKKPAIYSAYEDVYRHMNKRNSESIEKTIEVQNVVIVLIDKNTKEVESEVSKLRSADQMCTFFRTRALSLSK